MAGKVGTRSSGEREQVVVESYFLEADCSKNTELESHLHIAERTESGGMQITEADSVIVETTTIDDKERELLESASSMFLSISNTPGDFTERHVDTRTKERPTMSDLQSINKVKTIYIR